MDIHTRHIDILWLKSKYCPFYIIPTIRVGKLSTIGVYIDVTWLNILVTVHQKRILKQH